MRLAAVKTAYDLLFQPFGLDRVLCLHHPLGKPSQFLGTELAAFAKVTNKFNDLVLLVARQSLDFLDNCGRCHDATLRQAGIFDKKFAD